MVSFGLSRPQWQTAAFYEAPSIGRLPREHAGFDPRAWKPRVPNRAFLHARPDDQFWAAQRLAALTSEMIAAAVAAGDFRDPESEAFLVRALTERRDAIVRTFLPAVNPIADPTLDNTGTLTFRNAAVDADVARAPRQYHAVWSAFDNATGDTRLLGTSTSGGTQLIAPPVLPRTNGSFVQVQLSSSGSVHQAWSVPVHAYFRLRGSDWQLVGFERLPDHQ
jgi:hypothetical protein